MRCAARRGDGEAVEVVGAALRAARAAVAAARAAVAADRAAAGARAAHRAPLHAPDDDAAPG